MTNHPHRGGKFELTFFGGTKIRYRRWHRTIEAAKEVAHRVLSEIGDRAAHPAIIYGPECGRDGLTIA